MKSRSWALPMLAVALAVLSLFVALQIFAGPVSEYVTSDHPATQAGRVTPISTFEANNDDGQ